jgi:hypothetical protein
VVADQLGAFDELARECVASFFRMQALVIHCSLGMALGDPTGRDADDALRNVLGLRPDEDRRWAFWLVAVRGVREDWERLRGKTRSYVATGVVWAAGDLPTKDEGTRHGLTAYGGSAVERNLVAETVTSDDEPPTASLDALERLFRAEATEERHIMLAALRDRVNEREAILLASLEAGMEVAEALDHHGFPWSVWNGLRAKADRAARDFSKAG